MAKRVKTHFPKGVQTVQSLEFQALKFQMMQINVELMVNGNLGGTVAVEQDEERGRDCGVWCCYLVR
ncbi:hypothetical protein TB2_001790 [Malus domestica]